MEPSSKADDGGSESSDQEEAASSLLEKVIPPTCLKESAGANSCCIFRVPQTLGRANDTAYEPKIVSIGPYHRSGDQKKHLKVIEEHKQRYLKLFVSKSKENGVDLSDLIDVVTGLEKKIRDSYSEDLDFNQQKLIKMMILDGCFILMLFLVVSRQIEYTNSSDPIFKLRWILPTLRSDLLLLENQVPLFLLKALLQTSKLAPSSSVNEMAFKFFNYSIKKPDNFWEKHKCLRAKHLLDLIRKTFIPVPSPPTTQEECRIHVSNSPGENSKPETQRNTCLSLCKIFCSKFNMHCSTEMTSYATFMGCLINTEEDATFLVEKGIIENYFGTGEQVSLFFKNIGKDISFSIAKSFLANVFEGVNKYTSQGYHVQWAGFKYTHFNTPWTFLSSCAALVLLLLTIFQAFFAGYAYFRPPKNN